MRFSTFIGYLATLGLALDALTNIGTTGHNWALELLFALILGFASGLSHLYTRFINR